MIIVNIGIQDGEREYDDWNYYNNSYHNEVVFQKIAHV